MKEPRLPPSSNYMKGGKSVNKKTYRPNKTGIEEVIPKRKIAQHPVISYRNQSEIMKKIFGNE